MREKVKRILDLVRAGKLTLGDAAPLMAALSPKLALTDSDRDLVASLLAREELDTAQVAEHLLLLRGIKDVAPVPPAPPRPPQAPRRPQVIIGGRRVDGLDDLGDRLGATLGDRLGDLLGSVLERLAAQVAHRAEHLGEDVEERMNRFAEDVERTVSRAVESGPSVHGRGSGSNRILRVQVESQDGDEYAANIPISLAPHLDRLIPPHGVAALESAGFSLDTLRLLIEANPPPGPLIDAEDQNGNEVHISIK